MISFTANSVSKEFNRKKLFENVFFSLTSGSALAIAGRNGSGKSTLVKILCGLQAPTTGEWKLEINNALIPLELYYKHIGLVSPYLNLYDEFSGIENLEYIAKIRGLDTEAVEYNALLENFGLYKHRKKELRYYSSGMKQRLKYCAALLHKPKILFLDEPQSNLDSEGISVVRKYMKQQPDNGILIFATNDADDLQFAQQIIDLNELNLVK